MLSLRFAYNSSAKIGWSAISWSDHWHENLPKATSALVSSELGNLEFDCYITRKNKVQVNFDCLLFMLSQLHQVLPAQKTYTIGKNIIWHPGFCIAGSSISDSEIRNSGIINTPRLQSYLHKSISKVNTISEISVRKVPVQGSRVELRQHKNLVYSTIDAVAHRDVYKPIAPSNWYLQNTMNCIIKTQNL